MTGLRGSRARARRGSSAVGAVIPADLRADRTQALFDGLVAAVDMVHAADLCLAVGDEAGQDQAGAGAQVGGHDGGAAVARGALNNGGVAVDVDVGAEATELRD